MKIGRYTVTNPHQPKEGGQAFVYFAVDPGTGADVAIKVARPSGASRKRMKQEIKAHRALNHPNILEILAHGDDHAWYAMQRADASLDAVGPFPRQRWTYLRVGLMAVASAVAHAHSKGYVHRDLSPGNVLVFQAGWAVADWGLVQAPLEAGPRLTRPLEGFGTPQFSAPEVLSDPTDVGPASDVYSIGRLAAWGTGLKPHETDPADDSAVGWWRFLIDNTADYNPRNRWTMQDIQTYLRGRPLAISTPAPERRAAPTVTTPAAAPVQRVAALEDYRRHTDLCPHCRRALGRDANERCLGCHAAMGY